MVNGWCFGGAFTPLVCCDLAIAAEDASFGLSEVNWGIPPGGLVSRALAETIPARDAQWYVMTGERFDGRQASAMRLVNEAVPGDRLRARTVEVAGRLAGMNTHVLRAAKVGVKKVRQMSWDVAEDYLYAKLDATTGHDPEQGKQQRPHPVPRRQDLPPRPRRLRQARLRLGRARLSAPTRPRRDPAARPRLLDRPPGPRDPGADGARPRLPSR